MATCHRPVAAGAFGVRRRDVIGVARHAVADHLAIDLGAALLGALIFLQHDNAGALAHDEAVAILVVRTARLFRLVVAGGKRARLGEAGDAERAERAFGAAGEHHVGIVEHDHARGVADRVGAGGAGGDDRVIGAHQAVFDRDLAGNEVDQATVHEMRADAARPLFVQDQRFFSIPASRRSRSRSRRRRDSGPPPTCREAGILDRLAGRVDAVDDERIDLALDLVIDALARIEAEFVIRRLDLAGDLAGLIGRIEARDPRRAAAPATMLRQLVSTSAPTGVTSPKPVTTTRRITANSCVPKAKRLPALGRGAAQRQIGRTPAAEAARAGSGLVLLDIVDRVLDGRDLLGGIVRDFDAEFFLESHDELDDVEAVRAEIVDEARLLGHLLAFDAQVLDNNLLHAVSGLAHQYTFH
jgi:hypothetical protein